MDFQYDNQIGQVDPQSPFMQNGGLAKKRKLESFASKPVPNGYTHEDGQQLTSRPTLAQPGTHSVLESPSKSAFPSTPNRMRLGPPNGQSYFFPQDKQLPAIPQHVQRWEPRTPQSVVDYSSGGDTPNTPAQDSDAATPDTQLASKMGTLTYAAEKKSPKKSKRASLFRMFTGSPSPTKEAKEDSRKPYSKKVEHRVTKRRTKQAKMVLRDDYDSDNEQSATPNMRAPKDAPPLGFAAKIPGVLAWVEAHPNLPAVLSYYMQFTVNATLGFGFLWLVYLSYAAVMNDIARERDVFKRQILHEITICANEYRQNRCERNMRVPALEQACNQWDLCMQQDADKNAGARVGARTFAMIFNAFVDEFSWKSMVFALIFLFAYYCLRRGTVSLVRIEETVVERQQHAAREDVQSIQTHYPQPQSQLPLHDSDHTFASHPQDRLLPELPDADLPFFH
jgi:hypothetical protein